MAMREEMNIVWRFKIEHTDITNNDKNSNNKTNKHAAKPKIEFSQNTKIDIKNYIHQQCKTTGLVQ
jgi:hypothetical protein